MGRESPLQLREVRRHVNHVNVGKSTYLRESAAPSTPWSGLTGDTVHTNETPDVVPPIPMDPRASSGVWAAHEDQTLLMARMQGLSWGQIRERHFSNKTPNACRKRHDRLMERKGENDWDARSFRTLAREYMAMRKDIWAGLAARTGERWNVVEQKCMSNGLKNLQSAARTSARRERLESNKRPITFDDDEDGVSKETSTVVSDLAINADVDTVEKTMALSDVYPRNFTREVQYPSTDMWTHRDTSPISNGASNEGATTTFSPLLRKAHDSAYTEAFPSKTAHNKHYGSSTPTDRTLGKSMNVDFKASSHSLLEELGQQTFRSSQRRAQIAMMKPIAREAVVTDITRNEPDTLKLEDQDVISSINDDLHSKPVTDKSDLIMKVGPCQNQLQSSIIESFAQWIIKQLRSHTDKCYSGNDPPNPDIVKSTSSSNTTNHGTSKAKRSVQQDGNGEEDSDDDHHRHPKKSKSGIVDADELRFACSFFKNNPALYKNWRSCPGPGFKSVHRVKEHLYRRHMIPRFKCPRCCEPFQDQDELVSHQRVESACPVRNEETLAGMTEPQERKIRARSTVSKSEYQRWVDIYGILFPSDDSSNYPSPYHQVLSVEVPYPCSHQEVFSGLESYVRREAPRLLQHELECLEFELKTMINHKLKCKLGEVLPRLQLQLIDDFRNSESAGQIRGKLPINQDPAQGEIHPTTTEDLFGFLEGIDWNVFPECDFDIGTVQLNPDRTSTGS